MRRFLIIVAVVAVALLGSEVLVRATSPLLPEPLRWYSGWAEEKASLVSASDVDAEVVFLGDSSTMRAMDPAHFVSGSACWTSGFNAAIPAATVAMIQDYYVRVIEPEWSPGTVVIGLTSRTITDIDQGDYFVSLAVREDWKAELNRRAADVSALVEYRAVLRDPARLVAHCRALALGNDPSPWSALNDTGWSDPPDSDYTRHVGDIARELSDRAIEPENLDALGEFIESLNDDGVSVVVAWMPVTDDWVDGHVGGASTIRAMMEAVESEVVESSAMFVDLSSVSDESLFSDPLHLNAEGSRQAVNLLLRQMHGLGCHSE